MSSPRITPFLHELHALLLKHNFTLEYSQGVECDCCGITGNGFKLVVPTDPAQDTATLIVDLWVNTDNSLKVEGEELSFP